MVKVCMLGIATAFSLSIVFVAPAAEEKISKRLEQQRQMDERLASELQRLIICKSHSITVSDHS